MITTPTMPRNPVAANGNQTRDENSTPKREEETWPSINKSKKRNKFESRWRRRQQRRRGRGGGGEDHVERGSGRERR